MYISKNKNIIILGFIIFSILLILALIKPFHVANMRSGISSALEQTALGSRTRLTVDDYADCKTGYDGWASSYYYCGMQGESRYLLKESELILFDEIAQKMKDKKFVSRTNGAGTQIYDKALLEDLKSKKITSVSFRFSQNDGVTIDASIKSKQYFEDERSNFNVPYAQEDLEDGEHLYNVLVTDSFRMPKVLDFSQ